MLKFQPEFVQHIKKHLYKLPAFLYRNKKNISMFSHKHADVFIHLWTDSLSIVVK